MLKQFIGKPFWITLGVQALIFAVAALVFGTNLTVIVLAVVFLSVLVLSWQKLEFGLAVAFAELMANSHGHLISAEVGGFPLSLRMTIFLAVMLAWVGLVLAKKVKINLKDERLWPWYALAIAVASGFVLGGVYNDRLLAFVDGNAYLYAAYVLPILSIDWRAMNQRLLLQVLAGSAAWVVALSLGLLYLYTHFSEPVLVSVYTFIRDTRTGEITRMEGGFYRVFMQSQFWVFVMALLLSTYFWVRGAAKRDWKFPFFGLSACLSLVLISMSRSFWVGLIGAGVTFLGVLFFYHRPGVKQIASGAGLTLLSGIVGLVLLVGVVLFPFPQQGDLVGFGSLASRTGIDDAAVTSRWKLLDPMLDSIKMSPIIGHGFGEEIEFVTDDPRILEQDPSGIQRTHAFEWGWLEVMVKMGILGILAFVYIFIASFRGLQPLLSGKRNWLGVALISGLVMLYFTHIFSPYLNHPIGLGYLLFLIPFFQPPEAGKGIGVTVKELLEKQKAVPHATAAPLSTQEK